MEKKIIFFHLLNNYSGSPNVLSLVIKGLFEEGYKIELYTSKNEGFLSDIEGVTYHIVNYDFLKNRFITLFLFILAQIRFFIAVLKYIRKKNTLIYINTILPFGATLGAVLARKKVIYHVHEYPVNVNPINRISMKVFKKFSGKTIFVSKYLNDCFDIKPYNKRIVYNALSPNFVELAHNSTSKKISKPYNILMVCSLRIFKGVNVFVELAKRLPEFKFNLVLTSTDEEIEEYFKDANLPKNIVLFPTQTNLHPFYSNAHLLVNLSLPNLCVETFGLTALEGVVYGIPVIVPPVGGISEIVDQGIQGFKVDSRDLNKLTETIKNIFSDENNYYELSSNAKQKANNFTFKKMVDEIEKVINEV